MSFTFKETIKSRRSYYFLKNESPISDAEIEDILRFASDYIPSAFNSQSTRLVLLLGNEHIKLWNIVKESIRPLVSPEIFISTEKKIVESFESGYGTILFFEDNSIVKKIQERFPLYSKSFPDWSQHTSAMHQLAVWTMLEDVGFGASLQHYNPLIDNRVCEEWGLSDSWSLVAQMPFGVPLKQPDEKQIAPSGDRVLVFK